MKHFIDNNGFFEVNVPYTWKYSLIDSKIHTFQEYDLWKFDTFQISLRENSEEYNSENLSKLNSSFIGPHLCFRLPDSSNNELTTKYWISLIEGNIVFFTLTISLEPVENIAVDKKIEIAHKVISQFKIIKSTERTSKINSYRFSMFLQGVDATSLMLSKAVENKAFIEATCLLASQIDALLRIGIVLMKQLINKNSEIEVEWIYQGLTDTKISEKEIYLKSKEIGIIDETIYKTLYNYYDNRNRVVHRFIISEITLAEIESIAFDYYQIQKEINSIVYKIESEQIELNVGMTTYSTKNEFDDEMTLDFIKGKIGKLEYFEKSPAGNS